MEALEPEGLAVSRETGRRQELGIREEMQMYMHMEAVLLVSQMKRL